MENSRLPFKIGAPGYWVGTLVTLVYEFFGTAFLVGIFNASSAHWAPVSLGLFMLLLWAGPITGAHFNPAVTIGVFLNKLTTSNNGQSQLLQMVLTIVAQISGGIGGLYTFYGILLWTDNYGKVTNSEMFPMLNYSTSTSGKAEFVEIFATFIFVWANLLVKDKTASQFSNTIGQFFVGFAACALIAGTMAAMLLVAVPLTGGSINPVISITQSMLAHQLTGNANSQKGFWTIYMQGPLVGAVLAGMMSWIHAAALKNFGPLEIAEDDEEEESLEEDNSVGVLERLLSKQDQDNEN